MKQRPKKYFFALNCYGISTLTPKTYHNIHPAYSALDFRLVFDCALWPAEKMDNSSVKYISNGRSSTLREKYMFNYASKFVFHCSQEFKNYGS